MYQDEEKLQTLIIKNILICTMNPYNYGQSMNNKGYLLQKSHNTLANRC